MHYWKKNLISLVNFFKNTRKYFRDVLLAHTAMLFLLVPLLVNLTKEILRAGNIHYLSYTNIGGILTRNPWVCLALFLMILSMVLVVFVEFTFLTVSMYFIKKKQEIGLLQLLKFTASELRRIRFGEVVFFLFYFFLILPFGGLASHLDLLSTIKIPAFIIDFIMVYRGVFLIAWLALVFSCLYLGVRFIFVLPILTLKNTSLKRAIQASWICSKRKFFHLTGEILWITLSITACYWLVNFLLLKGQELLEHSFPAIALQTAIFNMLLIQIGSVANLVLSTVSIYYVVIDHLDEEGQLLKIPDWFQVEEVREKKQQTLVKLVGIAVLTVVAGIYIGKFNKTYLTDNDLSRPLVISHRGVSQRNGVQNTLPSLEKTSKLRPDFIEMDIQETKDHEFVLMHDKNLKDLTGVNKSVREMTLGELTKLTASENGQKAKLSSFDDYLTKANQFHQRLLIELKDYSGYREEMVRNFLQKYRENLRENGHRIHSLLYPIIQKIKEEAPELYCSYILPVNLIGPPESLADAFTMEYSTLNESFVQVAHASKKQVYAWTVNDTDSLDRMRLNKVDAVITDDVQLVQGNERQTKKMSYTKKLWIYSLGIGYTFIGTHSIFSQN